MTDPVITLDAFYQEIPEGFTPASELPKIPLATRLRAIRRQRLLSDQESMSLQAIKEAVRNGEIKRTEEGWHILRAVNPQLFTYLSKKSQARMVDQKKAKLDRKGE